MLSGAAAVAFLAIALLAISRLGSNRLARHLGMLSVGVFAYNILEVAYSATHHAYWAWLEYAAAAFMTIPALYLFVGFVGMARKLRWPLRFFSAYFAVLGFASLAAFVVLSLRAFPGSSGWAVLMLAGMVPSFGLAGQLVARHIRRSQGEERARARLFAAALLLGVGSVMTDLFAVAGLAFPRLSLPGLIVSAGVVAAIVLKARIFARVTALTIVNAAVVALLAVVALTVVFAWAGSQLAFFVGGTVLVCLALVAALRPILYDFSEQRTRTQYLATLGRFAEQMAHDVRNPLAAIRGAGQYLREELAQGRSIDDQEALIDIIIERSDRLERVVKDYQRMGRVDLCLRPVDINELVEGVLTNRQWSQARSVSIETDLAPDLPQLMGDGDLLTNALENVVRNAAEAMQEAAREAGLLHVSTARITHERGDHVSIRVRDDGVGMDVRTREQALDDFFTTKAQGSGLGLPFVARIVQAHGGTLALESEQGRGTTVHIELPAAHDAVTGN